MFKLKLIFSKPANRTYIYWLSPQGARDSSFKSFLEHTQWRTTVGRTPLDDWSVCHRDLYLTTHNTHNRQTSIPPVGFEPTFSAGKRPQTYILDRTTNGTGPEPYNAPNQWQMCDLKLRLRIQVFFGMWCCVAGLVFPDALKALCLLETSNNAGAPQSLNLNALCSFTMSWNTNPAIQCHVSRDLDC